MKTKILILALAAFCSFSSISAGNCIDNLFNTASRMPNASIESTSKNNVSAVGTEKVVSGVYKVS